MNFYTFSLLRGNPSRTNSEKMSKPVCIFLQRSFEGMLLLVSFAWLHLKWRGSNWSTTVRPPSLYKGHFSELGLFLFRFICTVQSWESPGGILFIFPQIRLRAGSKVKQAMLPPKQDITVFFFSLKLPQITDQRTQWKPIHPRPSTTVPTILSILFCFYSNCSS